MDIDVYNRDGDIIKKYETYIGAYLSNDEGFQDIMTRYHHFNT